jgi:F0F1-type ATP synthase assembly protein I
MGIVDQLKTLTSNAQQGAKMASITLTQRLLRLVTGFFVGIVLALILQEFTQSGTLMLVFFMVLFMMIIYRLLRSLSVLQILIFDVICILIAILLRMYIMLAP